MSEQHTLDDDEVATGQLATTGESASIDVTRYKTDELRQRFQQLFGVAHLVPWAVGGLAAPLATTLILWAGIFLPRAGLAVALLTFIYMGLQGFFLGVAAAALLVVTRVFQQLTAIVDITLQTLREVFSDVKKLGDAKARAELAGALIHGAIIPTVQSVIALKVGLLRMPVSFVINRILGKSAKMLTKNIEKKALPLKEMQPENLPAKVPDDTAPSHLDKMQDRIELIARRTRRATLIPATVLFVMAAGVSSIPWLFALLLLL